MTQTSENVDYSPICSQARHRIVARDLNVNIQSTRLLTNVRHNVLDAGVVLEAIL